MTAAAYTLVQHALLQHALLQHALVRHARRSAPRSDDISPLLIHSIRGRYRPPRNLSTG
ncbi:hypothetical protein [Streptomyces europaeiscabiei]|uniref:hypothetical protein n=1 Tax=Streptomyces europaeiscabiei TaxID=146819 RepID=UPI0029AFACD2|nr:hypothetical protein [Streptomyces europaeiscabiei]MDX3835286.1 hypothetical protein [Streptomyces europaeiscabiei]